MVHKKYIKRGGKTFGPYLYENYRENGITKTRYLGLASDEKKLRVNKNFIFVAGALFLILSFVFLFSFYNGGITGKVTSEITPTYSAGEIIQGTFSLELKESDLIPADSILKIKLGNQEHGINIGSLLDLNSDSENLTDNETENFVSGLININLADLNISAETGNLEFSLISGGNELIKEVQEINVEKITQENNETENATQNLTEVITEEINQTIEQNVTEEVNETAKQNNTSEAIQNESEITEPIIEENITITENKTTEIILQENVTETDLNKTDEEINFTIIENETDYEVITKQYRAVIGKPVKWIKTTNATDNLVIEIPKEAENISIKTGEEVQEALDEAESEQSSIGISMTGSVIGSNNNFLTNFLNWLKGLTITGQVISEEDIKIIENENSKTVELENIELNEEVAVEYYTEAPESSETNIESGKKIIISASDELSYKDILAYTNLPKEVSANEIKLYHLTNGSREEIQTEKYDLNQNGLIDYVEWNVPHLSEQTYELIIEISNAEHLDSNREFISDIYNSVSVKDNVWSETINNGEYVRITFEQKLTNANDITIYARGNATIEVYEKDGSELIATFPSVNEENYYKIYLTNLENSQDSFDLKVLGNAEFDYIVDPLSAINFVSPTLPNRTAQFENSIFVNVSITTTSDSSVWVDWNRSLAAWWNFESVLTNGTVYDNSTFGNNGNLINHLTNTTTPGIRGDAISFNGIDGYMNVSSSSSLNLTDKTIAFWGKLNSYKDYNVIYDDHDGNYVGFFFDNDLKFYWKNSSGSDKSFDVFDFAGALDTWEFYSIVYDINGMNVNISFYRNNTYVTSQTNTEGLLGSPILTIGSRVGGTNSFNGSMDEFMIFSRALSYSEILSLYNASANQYHNNFTNLAEGYYTYKALAIDSEGNVNSTAEQTVTIDTITPNINFTNPTPYNGQTLSRQTGAHAFINVSTTDQNNHFAFLNWNKSIIGWWRMDDTNSSGDFTDYFGVNNGTKLANTTRISNGKFGKGLSINGSNSGIRLPGTPLNLANSSFSISAWVNFNDVVQRQTLVMSGAVDSPSSTQYAIYLNFGGLQLHVSNGATTLSSVSPSASSSNLWYHVVGVWNQTTTSLYINGTLVDSDTNSSLGSLKDNGGIAGIGGDQAFDRYYLNGSIDEVIVFNRVLSSSEILSLYNASANQYHNNFTNLGDGNYSYKAYAIDSAGNINSTEEKNVSVYTVAPALNFTNPTPVNYFQGVSDFLINVSLTDIYLNNITYNWNGTNYYFNISGSNLTSTLGANFTFNITNLTNGLWNILINQSALINSTEYTYYVKATDLYGNSNQTETRTIRGPNSAPSTTTPVLFPTSLDRTQNLICNFTITDLDGAAIWDTDVQLSPEIISSKMDCDNDYCYGIDASGYFLKVNKTSGQQIFNRTNGYSRRQTTYGTRGFSCDTNFCYAGTWNGSDSWFLKVNKTSGIAIYNQTSGGFGMISSDQIYSMHCNDTDYCYAGDSQGYIIKVNKSSGEHIWNTTAGNTMQKSVYTIHGLSCASDYCYLSDAGGYFIKFDKTSGTTNWSTQLTTTAIYSFYCDSDYCYGGDSQGYFLKTYQNGTAIWNIVTGSIVRPTTSAIYAMHCDSDFCYGIDNDGYLLKTNNSNSASLVQQFWNRTANYVVRPTTNAVYGLSCDGSYCYGGNNGYFIKFRKLGDILSANLTWYKNTAANQSYILDVVNGTLINMSLNFNNLTKYDNWTCGVTPYDKISYGAGVNSSQITISNAIPNITFVQINPPSYTYLPTSANAYYYDSDADAGTLNFTWYVNGVIAENDILTNVQSGSFATTYLNVSKNAEDIISITVYANDSADNSLLRSWNRLIWNSTIKLSGSTNGIYSGVYCDSNYCYAGDYAGYFLKLSKTNATHIFNTTLGSVSKPGNALMTSPIFCDDNFCYQGDYNGYFIKLNKTSGVHTYNTSTGYTNRPSTTQIDSLYCDSGFCYGGDGNGYFLKINKTSGVHIYNTSTGYTNRPSTGIIYGVSCDEGYCYGVDASGYFLKINKTSGVHTYNTSTGYTNRPSTNPIYSLYCNSEFCYAGDSQGYFLKINKTSGTHVYNITLGYTARPTTNSLTSMSCDYYSCYAGDSQGYFLKINKTSGALISTIRATTNTLSLGISCDADYCYAGDSQGYFLKIFQATNVTVENYPEISFVSGTTTASGNYSQNSINANVSINSNIRMSIIQISIYNSTGLVNSSTTTDTSLSYLYTSFTGLSDAIYYLNATLNNTNGGLNKTETRTILLDTTPPVINITSPDNTSISYSATIEFNATVNDALQSVSSCQYSLDGAANVTMTLNASKTFANYTYSGITHGYHNLTISCNDTLGNMGSSTELNFQVTLLDLSISNVTLPSPTYSNSTFITINVSNQGPPTASNVNVSCYYNNVLFESKVIDSIAGTGSYITNCTRFFTPANNQNLTVVVDALNAIAENNETNNNYTLSLNITQIANITIETVTTANTTDSINIQGQIIGNNGSSLANKRFTIKLNNVTVSSNTLNFSNFVSGTATQVNNSGNTLRLNLSSEGNLNNYADTYSTNAYLTDPYVVNHNSEGFYAPSGVLFHLDDMTSNIGNITYKFNSVTKFYNATAYVDTHSTASPSGANISLLYSFDNVTWNILASTISSSTTIGGAIPSIDGKTTIYLQIKSDTFGGTKENPVTRFEFNYTNYNYSAEGNLISSSINLPNVTYTLLKWDQQLNGGAIKIQLRESDDNSTWGAWSNNYTSNLENTISGFSKQYLQYRAWLSTTNQSLTPVLYSVNISYFNASTNSSGGYNYNITIPTTNIGVLPLEVSIQQTASENDVGISGTNTTNIAIWARTTLPYFVVKNYSSESNYSVHVNFTRSDTNNLVNGTINVTIYNSTTMLSKTCYASFCTASWLIPSQLGLGNYTINITGHNESAYYQNATSISFADYLEEKNTTGTLFIANKTISDYNPSNDYFFYLNATINNTGSASMNNPHVWSSSLESGFGFANVTEITPCADILPNKSCNALILVTVKSGLGQSNNSVTWRANWTDNDGSVSGGVGYISYNTYINILSNASMSISNYSVNKTIQHEASDSFIFYVNATGTDAVTNINVSFIDGDLASWITLSPNWIAGLVAGGSQLVTTTVTVPAQTSPGNYSGIINVSSTNAGEQYLNLTITVPENLSWYFVPTTNFTNNHSFSLNTAGEVANYTIVNMGNVNLTMNVTYSPRGGCNPNLPPYDYTCQGTTIFETDYGVYNPSKVNVTKGENTTFTVYQKGFTSALTDVRVIVKFYNESANPVRNEVEDRFNIYQMPPNITNVWFYLDGVIGNKSEVNKNLTIKVRATDDVNINETATKINVTYGSTTITLNATSLCGTFGECAGTSGARTIANFTANFTPTTTGLHSVRVIVYNTEATPQTYTSAIYTFNSYGTTTLNLSQNRSSISVGTIDKLRSNTFYLNYSVNNSGIVYSYNSNLSFSVNSSIVANPLSYYFGNLSSGTNTSKVFQINISALTPPGVYNLTANLNWTNPDNTLGSTAKIFNITVLSNKSIDYSPSSLSYTVASGASSSSVLTLNNSGNDLLASMNLNCYTETLCPTFSLAYNETNFNIQTNNSREINISVTAPAGTAAGIYTGKINITEQNISKTIDITITVPESWIWNLSPTSINATRGASSSGDLQLVTINNTGNINITFTINSSNSSLVGSNVSVIHVPFGNSAYFMLNYSAPATEGSSIVVVNVTNSSASPVINNITINLTSTQTDVTIFSPTTASPVQNVTSGMNISISANVSYAGTTLTENITWSVTVGGSSCNNLSAVYSTALWNVTCASPNITDGTTYDLVATMTHAVYGTIIQTETGAVIYKDLTAPHFNITRNNINKNNNINIQVNVTDNANVSFVSAVLTYPNSSQLDLSMTLSAGLYINNSINLTVPGEYIINITANDTTNNINSSFDWFEVYDNYFWNVNLYDYNYQAVPNVNITLYRPNSTTILANGTTNSTGGTRINVSKRFYDINVFMSKENLSIRNVNFSNLTEGNISLNLYKVSDVELSEIIPLYKPLTGIASNSTGFNNNQIDLIFNNYTQYSYDSVSALSIVKCADWNYTARKCIGSWTGLSASTDVDTKKVNGSSTGFSSYFLAENKCGNGLCEITYGETTTTCSNDCKTSGVSVVTVGGGGGGGGGAGASVTDIEKLLKNYFNVGGVKVETTSIYKEMFAGETATIRITLSNSLTAPTTVALSTEGDIKDFIFFESTSFDLEAHESRDVAIKIVLPRDVYPGNYDGNLIVSSGGYDGKIPMTVRILVPEGKLLDIKILPLKATVAPGKILRLQTDLLNLGQTKRVDVQFDLQLIDVNTGSVLTRTEEAFAVETTFSTIKNMTIPENTPIGKYIVKATAYYSNLEQQYMQASSIAYIFVDYPLLQRRFLGIPVWIYLVIALLVGSVDGFILTSNWLKNRKKRFKGVVEFNKLPTLSSSSIFIGKVAETSVRTFLDLNKLQMHTLIAGATGSGKTIAAQDIVEGALMHKKSVIIFDPTAQWTGFFRASDDKGMLKRYQYFDMKVKDARGFNGTIKTIHDPYEIINLREYMEREGEITIFDISNLTPADIDIIVASTTEQIFKSTPEESKELKALIVYDEVHRLLPKFGGSGRGFVQLERGAREFRKWGIGLLLISQVLSDFVGEIKANIATEIQMGTRYEGDLERISLKYGEDVLKSVVKEPIGTGMMVNAEYNSGKPYFVSFRPLLHSTKRLSNVELKKYEAYFDQIEDLDYQMKRLEQYGIDILDLKLELKITKDKVKAGQFQMVDMYLESLLPVVAGHWKSLGKSPEHVVRERLTKAEVTEGIEKAAKEREKYLKEHPQAKLSLAEELSNVKKRIEEKRKAGKNTTEIESKLNDFQNRLKGFKGMVSVKDAEGIMAELNSLKKILGGL